LESGELRRRKPEASLLHRAVREGWPGVAAEAEAHGGLPRRVHEEVRRYLRCGVLRWGFSAAKCQRCEELVLIPFSCKARGFCPSCAARRAHQAAAHLCEVLPEVGYRQWTLALPRALNFAVVKEVKLLRRVERELVRAIFRWQRRRARELGREGKLLAGAVSFVQLFNGQLALQPHLHLLVPEGLFGQGVFAALPPPAKEEVESVLSRMLRRLRPAFEAFEAPVSDDGLEALQQQGAQLRLSIDERPVGERKGRRLAVGMGFSLHADTQVHAHDRAGVARLARYGARGPIAESRLSRRDDGQYAYQTKKGVALVLTAQQLVRRLCWLIVPPRLHLTNFHGLFASHASARAAVLPAAVGQKEGTAAEKSRPAPVPARFEVKAKTPRLDWATLYARTWGIDVWTCRCGGKRKVLSVVSSQRAAEEMLQRLGLLESRPPPPPAQPPPQLVLAV